jgi:hypothetical protein
MGSSLNSAIVSRLMYLPHCTAHCVVLFEQERSDVASSLRKFSTTSVAALDPAVEAPSGLIERIFGRSSFGQVINAKTSAFGFHP